MPDNKNLILKNIYFQTGQNDILKKINLTAESGKITAIVGPSGSGKSTLIKIIAGLLKPTLGNIVYDQNNINNIEPNLRKIGYVSQNPSLLPHYNIWRNITISLDNISDLQKKKKAFEILKTINMEKHIDSFPNQLSIGQQQKISIVRALIYKPNIFLFDEPYANLDVINKDNLIRQTIAILKSSNAIKLLITHNPHEAMLAADYIYVLNKGKIIQSGTTNQLYDNPKNEFIARLFGMTNIIPAIIKDNQADTILGKHHLKNLNINDKKVNLLIRPHEITISEKQEKHTISAKISEKRFYYGQNLYYISPTKNPEYTIKITNKDNYNINDTIHLKISNAYILDH